MDTPPDKELSSKKSVLIIDDSEDALIVQKMMLESEGFKVFTARSGTQALSVLSGIDKPNLILLDMQMDDMSGIEFLAVLEEKRPEIIEKVPVVFLTGMETVPKSKAVGVIHKPMDIDQFIKDVHRYIAMGI